MNALITISEENCFVCNALIKFCKNSVLACTKFSERPIFTFIERFVGLDLTEELVCDANICQDCFLKFEDYDQTCNKAAEIQQELVNLFTKTQTACPINTSRETEDDIEQEKEEFIVRETEDGGDLISEEEEEEEAVQEFEEQFIKYENKDEAFEEYIIEDVECPIVNSFEEDEEEETTYYNDTNEEIISKDDDKLSEPATKMNVIGGRTKSKRLATHPFNCEKCNVSFTSKKQYQDHTSQHEIITSVKCTECNKILSSSSDFDLKLHNAIAHRSGEGFECPVCTKSFTNKAALTRHYQIHESSRPYCCEICGKRFLHHSSFTMHMLSHNDIREKICEICKVRLRSTSHLNRHMRTHTGEKPYACSVCSVRFAQKYNLNSHMKIHIQNDKSTRSSLIKIEQYDIVESDSVL